MRGLLSSRQWGFIALVVVLHSLGLIWLLQPHPEQAKPPVAEMTATILLPMPLPVVAPPDKTEPVKTPTSTPTTVAPTPTPMVSKTVTTAPAPDAPAIAPNPPNPPAPPAPPVVANHTPAPPAPPSAPRFDAAYLNNPAPPYPPISRRMNEQGKVLLHVVVGADGLPKEVSIAKSSGFPRLDDAAIAAVEKWRFVPAKQGDQAVTASVNVPINFKLD